jgi:hypothetical protein
MAAVGPDGGSRDGLVTTVVGSDSSEDAWLVVDQSA